MLNQALLDYLRDNLGKPLTPELAQDVFLLCLPQPSPLDLSAFEPETFDGVTFRAERMAAVLDEMRGLHAAHWQETEMYRHHQALDFDYDEVCAAEALGRYLLIAVRDESGRLVGNCGCRIYRSTHTKRLVGSEDTFYLLPEVRRGRRAVRLFKYAERCLRHLNVGEVRVSVKLDNDVSRLWERIGYKRVAVELARVFQEAPHVL